MVNREEFIGTTEYLTL